MKIRHYCTIILILSGITVFSIANAMDDKSVKISKIDTNYPITDHSINLPEQSSKLAIRIEAAQAHTVRFYYDSTEAEMDNSRQLIKEDSNPKDGFDCEMNYSIEDGFARRIIIEAIASNGEKSTKSFNVYKEIEVENES